MQLSSVVACSDLTVCASHCISQNCAWLGHPCAFLGECIAGIESGDNSGEEVRSVFVPICSEGAVL